MKLSTSISLNNICEVYYFSQNRYTQHLKQVLKVSITINNYYYITILVYIFIIYLPFGIFTFFPFYHNSNFKSIFDHLNCTFQKLLVK